MRRWPHRLRVAKNFPFSENSRDQISSPETSGPSVLSSTIGSSSLLSKSQMETVRPNPLYKQIISQKVNIWEMNGIFTRQSWEERSLFCHTKRGNKQCKANLTVSERTEDVVPRVGCWMLFPAFINLKISSSSLSTLQYIFSV